MLIALLLLTADCFAKDKAELFLVTPGRGAGAISASSTESQLQKAYGARHVHTVKILDEESEVSATELFPADEKRRALVFWKDEKAHARPRLVKIYGTRWKTSPGGVHLGMRLKELEHANLGVFTLAGFGWDYGGAVYSWRLGKLSVLGTSLPSVTVSLGTGADFGNKDYQAVLGEAEFLSSNPNMQKLNPRVTEMNMLFVRAK
ncbi:MAG: hypothetical protein ACXWP1_06125 [Bdellovibrionota bacterium]